jgi:hypothetical protein
MPSLQLPTVIQWLRTQTAQQLHAEQTPGGACSVKGAVLTRDSTSPD